MDPKGEIIKSYQEKFELILDEWGFLKYSPLRDAKRGQIISWLNNFLPSEIEDAILLLSKIQYKDSHLIQEAIINLAKEIKNIFRDNLNNVKFFPLGESPSSSGGMYLYEFRKDLGLTEDNFPYHPFNENLNQSDTIVFFDDIIGSGNQATKFAEKNLQHLNINAYYFSIFGYQEGIEKVRNSKIFKSVICEHILSDEERAFHINSYVLKKVDIRERLKNLCEKYGKILFPEHPLGYDNSQSLLVFPHNTPNNTLPVFWASENNEKIIGVRWNPIWERKKKLNLKMKDHEQNDSKIKNEVKPHKNSSSNKNHETQFFNSQKIEIGSTEGIKRFKELSEFAYNIDGLNMNTADSKKWALENLNNFSSKDISKFKELVNFAYSTDGLNMNTANAKEWALTYLNDFSSKDIEKFKELANFAYSTDGLNMNTANAKEWALTHLNDFSSKDIEKFKELANFAYSTDGLNMNTANAKEWALNQLNKKK